MKPLARHAAVFSALVFRCGILSLVVNTPINWQLLYPARICPFEWHIARSEQKCRASKYFSKLFVFVGCCRCSSSSQLIFIACRLTENNFNLTFRFTAHSRFIWCSGMHSAHAMEWRWRRARKYFEFVCIEFIIFSFFNLIFDDQHTLIDTLQFIWWRIRCHPSPTKTKIWLIENVSFSFISTQSKCTCHGSKWPVFWLHLYKIQYIIKNMTSNVTLCADCRIVLIYWRRGENMKWKIFEHCKAETLITKSWWIDHRPHGIFQLFSPTRVIYVCLHAANRLLYIPSFSRCLCVCVRSHRFYLQLHSASYRNRLVCRLNKSSFGQNQQNILNFLKKQVKTIIQSQSTEFSLCAGAHTHTHII